MHQDEILLSGGNMSRVSTDGKIVYRNLSPHSATVHRLLCHVAQQGFDRCPHFLGIDDLGREMLSFLPGETQQDYPQTADPARRAQIVTAAGALLRQYHDATAGFVQTPQDQWFLHYPGNLSADVICHNDYAPYNTTFYRELPFGMIDFDTACPAPRIWDVAYGAYRFVPLGQQVYDPALHVERNYDPALDDLSRKKMLHAFLLGYGPVKGDLKATLVQRIWALVDLFDERCALKDEAFIRMKEQGHQDFYRCEIAFIDKHLARWI